MKSGTSRSTVSYFSPSSAKAGGGLGSFSSMLQRLQTRLRTFVVFASKVWTFICYVFRKQTRSVSDFPSFLFTMVFWRKKYQHFWTEIISNDFCYLVVFDIWTIAKKTGFSWIFFFDIDLYFQLIQHKAITYNLYPLSPLSKHRLSKCDSPYILLTKSLKITWNFRHSQT